MSVGGTRERLSAKLLDQLVVLALLWPAFGASLWLVEGQSRLWLSWPYLLYFVGVPLAYESLSNWFFGRTVGKWVFGLRLASYHGPERELGFGACLVRALAERLSFYFSWAVYAPGWLRRDRRHLADWIAGTQVVFENGRALESGRRPILALLGLLFFSALGWETASRVLSLLQWDASGMTLNF